MKDVPAPNRSFEPRGPWPQVCFMHVGKTAGSAVHRYLTGLFDPARVFHRDPDAFDAMAAGEADAFDLVIGHLSHRHLAKFHPHRVAFAVVREPVARVCSSYWFLRGWDGPIDDNNRVMVESARRYSFLDFLKDDRPQVRMVTRNQQAYTFASDWRAPRDGDGSAVLAAAVGHLDDFLLVGLQERADESLGWLARRLGWPPPPPLGRVNVTRTRSTMSDLTAAERDAAAEANPLDTVLYAVARRRFEAAAGPPATAPRSTTREFNARARAA